MKTFTRFFATGKSENLNTYFARQRLANTMPGETGALSALRLTGIAL